MTNKRSSFTPESEAGNSVEAISEALRGADPGQGEVESDYRATTRSADTVHRTAFQPAL